MGSRRGFICRLRMGNVQSDPMTANHTVRMRQRNTLGPASDGNHYAVVHVTGYIKNWPPSGSYFHVYENYRNNEISTIKYITANIS